MEQQLQGELVKDPYKTIHTIILVGTVPSIFIFLPRVGQHGAFDKTGGFKYFLFSPLFGEDSHFDYYFSNGLKPPTSYLLL